MAKHPHDAVIRAWLDGKTIQWRAPGFEWNDSQPFTQHIHSFPSFNWSNEYRIKPETIRYRVALWKVGAGKTTPVTCLHGEYDGDAQNPNFIRWLGDEQEVEV